MKKGDTVVCTEDFFMRNGARTFTKDKEYSIINSWNSGDGYREYVLFNDNKLEHTLWSEDLKKYFKKK